MAGVSEAVGPPGPRAGRLATRPVWGGFVGLVLLTAAAGALLDPPMQYAPLLATALVLGVPHGAVDYLVPARLGDASPAASVGLVGGGYLLLGGGYALLWFAAPVVAAGLFVALTWVHWGRATSTRFPQCSTPSTSSTRAFGSGRSSCAAACRWPSPCWRFRSGT